MEHRLSAEDERAINLTSGGLSLRDLSSRLVEAINPDRHLEAARATHQEVGGQGEPSEEQVATTARTMVQEAVKPLYDPKLRDLLVTIKRKNEITIDHVSQDQIIEAGFSMDALERARTIVQSFEQFIREHKDEITALQILYSRPYRARLRFEDIKELASAIQKPPHLWNESQLWQAYAALEKSRVKGTSRKRILTDLVSLVRFAIHQDNELVPFPERVSTNFQAWLSQQEARGVRFTEEQRSWLEMIRDHIAGNLSIEQGDFEYAPFAQKGGLGRIHQLFGNKLNTIIEELNETLAA